MACIIMLLTLMQSELSKLLHSFQTTYTTSMQQIKMTCDLLSKIPHPPIKIGVWVIFKANV